MSVRVSEGRRGRGGRVRVRVRVRVSVEEEEEEEDPEGDTFSHWHSDGDIECLIFPHSKGRHDSVRISRQGCPTCYLSWRNHSPSGGYRWACGHSY